MATRCARPADATYHHFRRQLPSPHTTTMADALPRRVDGRQPRLYFSAIKVPNILSVMGSLLNNGDAGRGAGWRADCCG